MQMCIEIARGEGIKVRRDEDRQFLLDVKHHKYEYEEIIKKLDEKKIEMDEKNEYANTLVEHCYDCNASYRYLMHLDHPEKRQYEESDVIVFGAPVDEYVKQKTQYKIKDEASRNKEAAHDRVDCLIKELIDGMPFQMLIKVYGRDFIINYRHYCSTACICCLERYDLKNAKHLSKDQEDVRTVLQNKYKY